MKFDLKSIIIGFLFACCIFMYIDNKKPGRYQAASYESIKTPNQYLSIAIIDTHTGEIIKTYTAPEVEGWKYLDEDF